MNVVWDEPKRSRNVETHGLDFADARDRFAWAGALILPTHPGRHGTPRLTATGYLDGDLVTLVFAPLGTEALSFISLRPASRRERRRYDDAET
jgi:uncharacterized protein